MTEKKTLKKPATRRPVRAVVRRQCADEMVELRLLISCPGCGCRDCTGLEEEVESKVVDCGYCGTRSGPMR